MLSSGSAALPLRPAILALTVLAAAIAPCRGQTLPGGDLVMRPPPAAAGEAADPAKPAQPAPAKVQPPAAQPTAAQPAPSAAAAATPKPAPAPAQKEVQGPHKPAINQAIRVALTRAWDDAAKAPRERRILLREISDYYASRGDAPLWLDDHGQWTAQAHAVFQRLQLAAKDGLDLSAYHVYTLDQGPTASLAMGDVALSEAVAAYAFQASGGRVNPADISRLIGLRPKIVQPAQALARTSQAIDADAALRAFNPPQAGYLALRKKLEQLREAPVARLADAGPSPRDSVGVAVMSPRRQSALKAELIANMEFWRWLPRHLAADRLMVNVPEFYARLYRDNQLILSTPVIVGKPKTHSPLFSSKISYLIVNPSWNVPQSIIRKEMAHDLDKWRRKGFIIRRIDGRLHIRQPPGDDNALGRIKFEFPNKYAVYLHDTNQRYLFRRSVRAFSHGCIRVDNPLDLAVALLRPERGWDEARLESMYGPQSRPVYLPEPMPLHVVYFTMRVDENGDLRRFADIYGYMDQMRALLGLDG